MLIFFYSYAVVRVIMLEGITHDYGFVNIEVEDEPHLLEVLVHLINLINILYFSLIVIFHIKKCWTKMTARMFLIREVICTTT